MHPYHIRLGEYFGSGILIAKVYIVSKNCKESITEKTGLRILLNSLMGLERNCPISALNESRIDKEGLKSLSIFEDKIILEENTLIKFCDAS